MARDPEDNSTGTEIKILQSMEKAFYKNNPKAQKRNTIKSLEWFRKYVPRSGNRVRTSQMFRDRGLWADRIVPGRMYFFEYDPIHKDTLPIYDRYPLIFPWDVYRGKNGKQYMIAINLHFLSPSDRLAVMRNLIKLRNEKRYRKNTKLKISWQVLKSMGGSKRMEHCVKVYRMDHVKTKFITIPSQSWEIVLYLPLHRFVKGGKSKAWKK